MPLRTILGEILRRKLLWWRQKRQCDCERSHSREPVKYYFEDFFPLGAKNGVWPEIPFFHGFFFRCQGVRCPPLWISGVKICKIVFDGFPYNVKWRFRSIFFHMFFRTYSFDFDDCSYSEIHLSETSILQTTLVLTVDGGSSTFLNIDCPSLSPSRSRIKAWSREIRPVAQNEEHP